MILVAGLGNELFADDGFGVEVARRCAALSWPDDVVVRAPGIRGLDLAFALMEGYRAAVLVDAVRRGHPPGTLVVLDPCMPGAAPLTDTHALDPLRMLAMVEAAGSPVPVLRLVGCEAARIDGGDEPLARGLSDACAAAVEPAIALVRTVVDTLRSEVRDA